MTNELERQFFDTFGIEPKEEKYCYWECKKPELENIACNNTECEHYRHKIHYPQITDRILLELICIVTNHTDIIRGFATVEKLKTFVLEELIYDIAQMKDEHTKHQVRTLFEEGEWLSLQISKIGLMKNVKNLIKALNILESAYQGIY